LGNNGSIRVVANWACNNSAGAKTGTVYLGGTAIGTASSYTTSTGGSSMNTFRNRGVLTAQVSQLIGGASTSAAVYTSIDTSVNKAITITGDTATATDHIVLEGYMVEMNTKD